MLRTLFQGWGRQAAWAALAIFLALQAFVPGLFEVPRLALFDFYHAKAPRTAETSPVVMVAVDEASLKALGQWPWPRQRIGELVTKILAGRPAAVGLDMILPEVDRSSPEQWVREAGEMPALLREAVRRLPSHDAALGKALAAGPVAVGIGGHRLTNPAPDNGPLAPFRIKGAKDTTASPPTLPTFSASLRSVAAIDGAARGHGFISVDPDADGVFRRLPMVSVLAGRLAPSMTLELLRLTAKASWLELHSEADRMKGVGVGPLALPTQADGSVWVHFAQHNPSRYLAASDVLAGKVDPTAFEQRVVVVGVTALGVGDWRLTPAGNMPGMEINAQLLENVLDGKLLQRPGWTRIVEPALTAAAAIFLIVVLRLIPVPWQILLTLGVIAALGAVGFWLWKSLLLVDVATPAIGQALVALSFIAGHSAENEMHKRQLRRELEARKLALAKAEGEMEAGRRIQMGMLPGVATVAGDKRFDLGALMVPARQIGGDLYDFFKIDERRLFFAVGDVSGKGVPAALFMALGKSLCRSYALRGTNDVGAIINLANGEIARDNPEMLFITMFAGILDLATGEVQFVNAGHDAPYVLRPGKTPEAVAAVGGPPLCVVEDFVYQTERLTLKPGEMLCLATDGVAEAMDASGALLGAERTKQILAAMPEHATASEVVDALYKAVGQFVGAAEASDDLTVLAVRWNGP